MVLNKLTKNYKKTECDLITHKKQIKHFKLQIDQNVLGQKNQVNFLGVIIDNKLNRESHVKKVCSKLARGSWAVLQLRNYVHKATLRILYISLIQSQLILY